MLLLCSGCSPQYKVLHLSKLFGYYNRKVDNLYPVYQLQLLQEQLVLPDLSIALIFRYLSSSLQFVGVLPNDPQILI